MPDSGGPGEHRGGLSTTRTLEVTADEITLSCLFDRAKIPGWGLFGGKSGGLSKLLVKRVGDDQFRTFVEAYNTVSPTKFTNVLLKRGDVVRYVTPGGGGYGDPFRRDPEAVLRRRAQWLGLARRRARRSTASWSASRTATTRSTRQRRRPARQRDRTDSSDRRPLSRGRERGLGGEGTLGDGSRSSARGTTPRLTNCALLRPAGAAPGLDGRVRRAAAAVLQRGVRGALPVVLAAEVRRGRAGRAKEASDVTAMEFADRAAVLLGQPDLGGAAARRRGESGGDPADRGDRAARPPPAAEHRQLHRHPALRRRRPARPRRVAGPAGRPLRLQRPPHGFSRASSPSAGITSSTT